MCSALTRIGYVYKNIHRKIVRLYLILGVLKLKALRSNCSKYGFVSVINALTVLFIKAILGHCTFIGNLDSSKLHFTAF